MKLKILLLVVMMSIVRMVQSQTVVDIIVNSPDHDTLEAAVVAAGLAGTLSGEGPFTVFAPTDDAFGALPAGTIEALLNDIPLLTSILTYHVAGVNALSTDLSNAQEVVTLNGESVTVTINAEGVFINDAKVTVADLVATNGVVHVINAVLLPPAASNTVVDIIVNSPDHEILETAVVAAGLAGTLSGEGPFTVFAPTDAAFNALPAGTIEALLNDIPLLTSILTYHVAGVNALSTDLTNGQEVVTLNGESVTVTINAEGVFINDAQVTVADLVADNGVVHVIDAVLLPPAASNTVVDIIVNSPDHEILETAVVAAGLAGTLSGEGPFTVFAPTDTAFNALPAGTIEALLNDIPLLTSILTYHVAGANVLSTDLYDGREIRTLNGKVVRVNITPDGVFINDAKVTVADIIADNGVVHVIDAVLLPSSITSVFDIIAGSDVHNTLETGIRAAELVTVLSEEDESYTVFAPTDAAFAALPAGVLEAVLADKDLLRNVLAYHAVDFEIDSTDLSSVEDFGYLQMLNGKTVTIEVNGDGIIVNNAKIIVADLFADNGVVHVIDAVLLAPDSTIIDVVRNSPVHTILENLLDAAEFSTPLEGYGPFTLFAPTNAAIQALPAEVIQALTDDPGLLEDVLAYHLVPGSALSSDLSNGLVIETLLGKNVTVTINNDGVFINDAKVVIADIRTDNGVVHVLDAVLLPKSTVIDVINEVEDLSTAALLIDFSGLNAVLNGDGPFTVFAPDDNAFDNAPLELLQYATENQENLQNVLLFHTVPGRAMSTDLSNGQSLVTANGKTLLVSINNDGVFINNAKVIQADLEAENGVVHIIDEVLDILTSLDDIIENKVSIYPNPTADYLRIYDNTYSSNAVYFITDMQNKIVRQGKLQETEQIDVREIQSGQYQLLIQDGVTVSSGKFVKVF